MKLQDKNLYYVGGCVRDDFIGVKSFDIDYCYEGNAIEFARTNNLNIVKENPDFGTVRIIFENTNIDIASTRKEIYPKAGHLPIITKIGCSLEEDLSRRDFTINAIAKRTTDGKIFDPYNGQKDIINKTLKILHQNSFIDDPTRIIRALKFAVRFNFELDENTKSIQNDYLKNINYDISYHRLKKELKETFNLNKQVAFNKFINNNIYKLLGNNVVDPNITTNIEEVINQYNIDESWIIYLGFFDLSNLELTRKEKNILKWYENLKTEKQTQNTPIESVIMNIIRN